MEFSLRPQGSQTKFHGIKYIKSIIYLFIIIM